MITLWQNETGPESAPTLVRPLNHLLDVTERGLAVEATRVCSVVGCGSALTAHNRNGRCDDHRTCIGPQCARPLGERNTTDLCAAHRARLLRTGRLGDEPVRPYGAAVEAAGERRCVTCGETKRLSGFYRRGQWYRSSCIECIATQSAQWCVDNPERKRAMQRMAALLRKYKITPERFEAMRAAQDNACPICGGPLPEIPCVDHDHSCCPGETSCGRCVRELLCRSCNTLLGMAQDDVTTLVAAAAYLIRHAPQEVPR